MKKNYTDLLIEDIYALANEPIPEAIALQAKQCVLDFLGTGLAGSAMVKEKFREFLSYFSPGSKEATLIGFGGKAGLQIAALVNGYSSHITELDDGHRFCGIHLSATVIPAVLAVAEHEDLSGEDLLRGVVIGYETAIRIGRAIQPSHKERGHHVSGTGGTIGAALGIAAALRFSKEEMKAALSAGIASAVGILEVLEDDSELKPYNIGRASHDGITAAYMARAGFKGPLDMLGGKRGLFALMTEKYDPSFLSGGKKGSYGIEMIYRKPYAACRYCHAPIEAVLNLRTKHNLISENIKEIKVYTYLAAIQGHDYTDIKGITSAKMSIPYSAAAALVTGKAGLNEFLPESIKDTRTSCLTKKIKVLEDMELSALVPEKRTAIVAINTIDGQEYIERVDYPRGEPENPMSLEELEEKFISAAMYGGKTQDEAIKIIQQVWNIEKGLAQLMSML